MNKLLKRKLLIKKLFKNIIKETIGTNSFMPVKLRINKQGGGNFCGYRYNWEKNKYIIKNKHNTIRFILYHEARHAYQRLENIRNSMSQETAEKDADSWALAHLKTRQKKRIEVGLNFRLNKKDWILTGFSKGLPLIACKQTGQEQRISDKILKGIIARA